MKMLLKLQKWLKIDGVFVLTNYGPYWAQA
jgi:hypothetical protein